MATRADNKGRKSISEELEQRVKAKALESVGEALNQFSAYAELTFAAAMQQRSNLTTYNTSYGRNLTIAQALEVLRAAIATAMMPTAERRAADELLAKLDRMS